MSFGASDEKRTLGSLPPRKGLTNGNGAPRAHSAGFTNGTARSKAGGFTNGSGRTNGSGFTNGSGRTNGSGFTNGSGRTNGSGFTNGSGRTNGSILMGAPGKSLPKLRARRVRRKAIAAISVVALLSVGAFAALAIAAGTSTPAVDGHFAEWEGRTVSVASSNAPGLTGFGFQTLRTGTEGYLEFDKPVFATRADVWLFIDEDLNPATGYWDGSLGADSAVRVSGDLGRAMGTAHYRFTGTDRFNLNALVLSGPARSVSDGARLEFTAPAAPRALSVSVALPESASASGAILADGMPTSFAVPASPALSGAVHNGIRIDGVFDDWSQASLVSDPRDDALPARLDLLEAAAVGDDASAQFYLESRGDVLSGTIPLRAERMGGSGGEPAVAAPPRRLAGTDLFELYLDTDLSASTGARVDGLGADLLLRVEGLGGHVVSTQLFAFAASSGWTQSASSAEAAASGARLEACLVVPGLVGARAKFMLAGFGSAGDANDQPIAVNRQAGAMAPGASAPSPAARGEPELNPIPEFGDALAAAGAVAGLTLLVRRRRSPRPVGSGTDG